MIASRLAVRVFLTVWLVGCTGAQPSVSPTAAPLSSASTSFRQLLPSLPGTADRSCVDVASLRSAGLGRLVGPPSQAALVLDIRSGDFVAGNFATDEGVGQPGAPDFKKKTYWIPIDQDIVDTDQLTITVISLDPPPVLLTETITVVAHAGDTRFWPSGVPLPRHGRWRIIGEGAGRWGCYELAI